MLTGDVGMGKTALLGYAAERARDTRVLTAAGVPDETDLPFAGLHGLLRPLLPLLATIPERQRAALSAGLAVSCESTDDVFAVAAGTLTLLAGAAAAEDVPVLVIVDDLQLWDATSRQALLFAARRTASERVGMILANGQACPDGADCGVPIFQIPPLDAEASRRLLARASAEPIVPAVADRLLAATAGVPLALAEIPGALTPGQLAGTDTLPEPAPVGGSMHRALAPRLTQLGHDERAALVVAAAAKQISLPQVNAALELLGLPAGALESAEAHGIIELGPGGVTFRHPLLRAVAYHEAAVGQRRSVHRVLAMVTSGATRGRHLGSAALEADEETAGELEHTAAASAGTSSIGCAAQLMQRAAELSGEGWLRARRCVRAAELWQLAGGSAAAEKLIESAARLDDDVWARATGQALLACAECARGGPAQAHRRLMREAVRVRSADPEAAAVILLDAAEAAWLAGEPHAALVAAQQAVQVAAGGSAGLRDVCAVQQAAILARGGELTKARQILGDRFADLESAADVDTPVPWWRVLWLTLPELLTALGNVERARRMADDASSRARSLGAYGILPALLALRAEQSRHDGDWAEAETLAVEAATLADTLGQATGSGAAALVLARLAAARGERAQCDTHLRRFRSVSADGMGVAAGAVEGLLELSLGDNASAFARLEGLVRRMDTMADPVGVCWLPDFVEAAVATGRRDEARRVLSEVRSRALGPPQLRCESLLDDDQAGAVLAEAVVCPAPLFEKARTELCLGEWLVMRNQGEAAGAWFRTAAATFDRLGAVPWAERARRGLPGCAPEPEPVVAPAEDSPGIAGLTSQEQKVALLVGQGATNREAASALYVSPKTIEFHLRSVYRKVGVRSRAELAHLIGQANQGA